MSPMQQFVRSWGAACEARGLTRFFAEVPVPDGLQSSAARSRREFLLASALGPGELDEVLSEVVLLTLDDAGRPTWELRRLSGQQAADAVGGGLTAHFARSFFRATRTRAAAETRSRRVDPLIAES